MGERRELLITLVLAGLCALSAGSALAPRLLVRAVPIAFEAPDITVSIGGEIARPGVYVLPFSARVGDLVRAAGGLTNGAEPSLVNLSAPLGDGQAVQVPAAVAADGEERINLNSATVEALDRLPGIGPVMARRIVAGRPYGRVEDLLEVKGIGERTLQRLLPLVSL